MSLFKRLITSLRIGKTAKGQVFFWEGGRVCYEPGKMLLLKARHGFGDNLMVTAVLESVAKERPDLQIVVLAKNPDIFAHNPYVTACYPIREIPKKHPVLRAATDMEYRPLTPRCRKKRRGRHLIDDLYDCLPFSIENRIYQPRLYLTDEELAYRQEELESLPHPRVAIAPYGKPDSPLPGKIYPLDRWRELTRLLMEANVTILQMGSSAEGPLLEGAQDWQDIGFRNSASVLRRCDLVVTHPGGMMHLARAVNTKCIAIYIGTEDPAVSGYADNINITTSANCAPCWREGRCRKPVCLDDMKPQRIADAVLRAVGR